MNETKHPSPIDLGQLETLARTPGASFLRGLALTCGGLDALAALTTDPVPVEPFDWSRVAIDDHPVVEEVLGLVERVVERYLNDEYLGIARRLVAMAAIHPAAPLRRRSSPSRLAAALVWLMLRGNERIGRGYRMIGGEDVWAWFGETSCAHVGRKIASAMRFVPKPDDPSASDYFYDSIALGDVGLLHSATRRQLLSRRTVAINVAESIEATREANQLIRRRPDGTMRIQASETSVVGAIKAIAESGRACVTLLFGASMDDPSHVLALSIPDARSLVHSVQSALDAPFPSQLSPS